jgi:subtilisin family serine protease
MRPWTPYIIAILLVLLTAPLLPNAPRGSKIQSVTPGHNQLPSHLVKKEIIVRFTADPTFEDWANWTRELDLTVLPHKLPQTYLIQSKTHSVAQLETFFKSKSVRYVEPHWLYKTQATTPNDEYYAPYQWNLRNVGATNAWDITKGSAKVKIAVIDTGVDLKHPDLGARLLPGVNVLDSTKSVQDDNGHGTHVAGIIAASVNNRRGIAGLTWQGKIMPIKALDAAGSGTSFSVADGIIEATDRGASVINLSLGNYAASQFLRDAVRYAEQHNALIVAASGNDNSSQLSYPAAYPEALAVAATTSADQIATFSNYGTYVDIAAPGDNIASTYMDNQYAALSGTSMATPHVTALAALIKSVNRKLTNRDVYAIITSTALDRGATGYDTHYGYGLIQMDKAVEKAKTWRARSTAPQPSATPQATIPNSSLANAISILEWLIHQFTQGK